MSKINKMPRNPSPVKNCVLIEQTELIELVKAKAERDLLLNMAAKHGASSYRLDDMIELLCKMHGVEMEK